MKKLPSQVAYVLAKRWYRYEPWHEKHHEIVRKLNNFTILVEFIAALQSLNRKGGMNHELDELAILLQQTFEKYNEKEEGKDHDQA